jgi:AraC-like DNA-binding protein
MANQSCNLANAFVVLCREGFGEMKSMSQTSHQLNANYQKLRSATLNAFNKTPSEILDEIRLDQMKRLLSSTSMSCRHIGLFVGFDKEVRTSRFFARNTGMTMSMFRKTNKVAPLSSDDSRRKESVVNKTKKKLIKKPFKMIKENDNNSALRSASFSPILIT